MRKHGLLGLVNTMRTNAEQSEELGADPRIAEAWDECAEQLEDFARCLDPVIQGRLGTGERNGPDAEPVVTAQGYDFRSFEAGFRVACERAASLYSYAEHDAFSPSIQRATP